MTLPNAHLAHIDPAKVHGYLLSPSHPIGRFKYAFFLSLGYTADAWERLRDDLLGIARDNPAIPGGPSAFGQKFEVDGMLTGPNGNAARINTVWIVLVGESVPRLVTAFPR
jgi:hypothetical protein